MNDRCQREKIEFEREGVQLIVAILERSKVVWMFIIEHRTRDRNEHCPFPIHLNGEHAHL
jgi:hypothetical protein